MEYRDKQQILLRDVIEISMPNGPELARVVMLGESYDRLDIDKEFIDWVLSEKILDHDSIVVEWVGPNPLAHNKLGIAPAGDYMFTGISEDIVLVRRGHA
tara:strand:+ start:2289 stop:2588 length:300 start_codon:yes stop_codon:yes gene_type:complete